MLKSPFQAFLHIPVTPVLLVLIALATGQQIWAATARTDAEFDRRATIAAEAAAAFVGQSLAAIKLGFQTLDGEHQAPGVVFTGTPAETRRSLLRLVASMPMMQGVGLLDRQGRVYVGATADTLPLIDLSDRPYFVFHRENRTFDLRVDRPVVSRPDNSISIPVSMRVETADGTFDGVVGARLDPGFFSSYFSMLGVEGVSLVDAQGHLYARSPPVDLITANARPLSGFSGKGAFALTGSEGQQIVGHSVPVAGSPLFVRAAHFKPTIHAAKLSNAAGPLLIGLVAAVVLVARSIRARTRAALDETRRFREVAHSKSNFLANMGHELRTPLNAILGFAEVIETDAMKLGVPANYRKYAADIRFSADHLLGVINRVLDMSKLEAGKWVLQLEKVTSATLIGTAVHLASQRAERDKVIIDTRDADLGVEFIGDERTLVQLLLNLTINAIKFAGDDRTVRLTCKRLPGSVEFTVTDKGRGMTREDAARALRPFETAQDEKARAQSDTGLGLPLSRLFAELHGGTLEIETAPGKGTCVRVVLPANLPVP